MSERDWSIIRDLLWALLFRYENNEGLIKEMHSLLIHGEELVDSPHELFLNYIPTSQEEKPYEAIKTKSFLFCSFLDD
jgi:hypothetical protein